MEYQNFLELVKSRRSIRNFKPDPVPDQYIDSIIEAARWAPSGFNLQPWEFVVVKKQELRDQIAESVHDFLVAHKEMEKARESWQGPTPAEGPLPPLGFAAAPVFIIPFGDTRTRIGLPMIHRFSDESWNKTLISTLASAFIYMHLAATSLGLASQWVSAVSQPLVHCQIKRLLGVPMALQIYDMMALGYPNMQPLPRMMRTREEIVHYDYCGDESFRTDEEVKGFIYKLRNPQAVSREKKQEK